MKMTKEQARDRRHLRIRRKIVGTPERPRLSVYKSLRHIYLQISDDVSSAKGTRCLLQVTSNRKGFKDNKKSLCSVESAKKLAAELAEKAKEKGIDRVVFDRSGYKYHGIVRAVAEVIREKGIKA
jgi:large subunit ribosomal protein L18